MFQTERAGKWNLPPRQLIHRCLEHLPGQMGGMPPRPGTPGQMGGGMPGQMGGGMPGQMGGGMPGQMGGGMLHQMGGGMPCGRGGIMPGRMGEALACAAGATPFCWLYGTTRTSNE